MIPSYVKKLSKESQEKWASVYNHFAPRGDEVAFIAANSWLQKHMSTHLAACSVKVRSVVHFDIDTTSPEFIKRTDSGEEYITAVLQDVYGDKDGVRWTPEILQRFADQINNGPALIGDIDHAEYDKILSAAMTDAEVETMFRQKKGIAKSVKAIFENGRLFIKALIDKRYKKVLQEQANGLSLEAVVTKDEDGRVTDGKLLGWTFTVKEDAANPRTTIIT
jgi:hypothetical protein